MSMDGMYSQSTIKKSSGTGMLFFNIGFAAYVGITAASQKMHIRSALLNKVAVLLSIDYIAHLRNG